MTAYNTWRDERLTNLALRNGYTSYVQMITEWYSVGGMSVTTIATELMLGEKTIRDWLNEWGVERKPRGGSHPHVVIDITPELLEEVSREGITATAKRLNVPRGMLSTYLERWRKKNG